MIAFKQWALCALLAMAPVVELRGALPVGLAYGLPVLPLYVLCVAANMLPVPFLMLFLRRILRWMTGLGGFFGRVSRWITEHGQKKLAVFYRYEVLGLLVLVAIPLPGTGAWTGGLVAALLDLRMRNALPVITLGVAIAGLIMLGLSLGLSGLISSL